MACFAECLVLARCVSSNSVRCLLFEQRADAGFVRQGEPIAGL
jgi:hypothetical protein